MTLSAVPDSSNLQMCYATATRAIRAADDGAAASVPAGSH